MSNQEFDLTRNDKFYELRIPSYIHAKDCVYYEFHLKNLVKNKSYVKMYRFKELKEIHEQLKEMQVNHLSTLVRTASFPQNALLEKDQQRSSADQGTEEHAAQVLFHHRQWPIHKRHQGNQTVHPQFQSWQSVSQHFFGEEPIRQSVVDQGQVTGEDGCFDHDQHWGVKKEEMIFNFIQ